MERTIVSDVWRAASVCYGARFTVALDQLLNDYVRESGKDEPIRITADCIGEEAYRALRAALQIKSRRHVSYYDYGWHIELRTWLFEYLSRSLQRLLVQTGRATQIMSEDLLAHDIGV
ncbi:hypothetical protein [Pseudomonas putida]|uniref:hypothetical protein n=1 Tax=Pseudomonas putida TaxID=303 RepID=UPI0023634961|nr:hypothetical protein [Pseudomonas putida]MDD1987664.1 hypothetical protein [Pseudomonas putida]HDS1792736.1 hypothetical protein [Pseudomonas putida]